MFKFFSDKFNNLKQTVSNTAQALVGNIVQTVGDEEEFSEFVNALNLYIDSESLSEVTLNNNSYTFVYEKREMSKNLDGVFTYSAGIPKYTGSYLMNIPLAAIFASAADANISNELQINNFKS